MRSNHEERRRELNLARYKHWADLMGRLDPNAFELRDAHWKWIRSYWRQYQAAPFDVLRPKRIGHVDRATSRVFLRVEV